MISPADIQVTKVDLTLFSTVLVVSNLVGSQLEKTPLFNEKWMNFAVATLLGVALHGLLTNKVSSLINNSLNVDNMGVQKSVYDLIKFGTIFVSQKAVTSYIEGTPVMFDRRWAMTSGLTIAGYSAFNMLESYVPKVGDSQQPLVNDLIKVSMGALAANYFVDGTINKSHLLSLASLLSGFVAFHLVTKQYVVSQEQFGNSDAGISGIPEQNRKSKKHSKQN
jgi:hypothetical protein